ncbi:MAG: hypothetical protein QW478_04195 [Candidatus Micrarchaeaceae archaeon]
MSQDESKPKNNESEKDEREVTQDETELTQVESPKKLESGNQSKRPPKRTKKLYAIEREGKKIIKMEPVEEKKKDGNGERLAIIILTVAGIAFLVWVLKDFFMKKPKGEQNES